jgi:hypothetical protein
VVPPRATLEAWARDHARLFETLDGARRELVRLDGPGTVTLRKLR